jgi:hypothetical protein
LQGPWGNPVGIVPQNTEAWKLVEDGSGVEKLLTAEIAEESQRTRRKAILLELLTLRVSKEDNNKSKINGDGQECPPHHLRPFRKERRPITFAHLLGEEVVEGFYGGEFVVFDVEDGVELGDVEDVVNLLGEIEELEFAACVADRGEATDEFADARAVEIVNTGEVEDDFLFALGKQVADSGAECTDLRAEDDAAMDVEDGDVGDFAGVNRQGHVRTRGEGRWPEW